VRFFIELAYDGGAYHGWQRQPNALTVQEVLEEVLGKFTGEPAYLTGQGRTDTGVHARQFFAHWDCVAPPVELLANPEAWVHTLNRILPADVSVQQILEVSPQDHARYSALSRTYEYQIHWIKNPFRSAYSWQIPAEPLWDRVHEATQLLHGQRDYSCFARSGGGQSHGICDLQLARWEPLGDGAALLKIRANRFLRNMVRAIVGTLMEVGRGYRPLSGIPELLEGGHRSEAGSSAPAHGLHLVQVLYPDTVWPGPSALSPTSSHQPKAS